MKPILSIIVPLLFPLLFSCTDSTTKVSPAKERKPSEEDNKERAQLQMNFTADPVAISKDFATWYGYTDNNIRLAQDFIGLDVDSTVVQKANFLDQLESGNFVPLKIGLQHKVPVYKLFKLQHLDKDIQLTIKQMATTEKEHFNMEGKTLPTYDFTDLNGRRYNKAATLGKTLLLKCWFINCFACVQEFPELNRLVDSFAGKDELLFVSLASDDQQVLTSFLLKKPFKYAVVPSQGIYMSEQLGITAYPTHLLVDKSGKIIKVTNSIDDMLPFLERQVGRNRL